jgi:TrmH family RNA methyltransferase
MITSAHNPRIQWVRKLQAQPRFRQDEGLFVLEGVRLVEEALQAGWQPSLALYTPDLSPRGLEIVHMLPSSIVEEVTPSVMKSASDTRTPQGLLTVVAHKDLPLPSPLDFVLVLDALRDPGNLGTILRTALAAGVQGVFLAPGSVDPFLPKVLRSAMGAHFHLPLRLLDWPVIATLLKPGFQIYLAEVAASLPYTQADFHSPVALVIGGEAEGASAEAQRLADVRIYIPMAPGVESLNAAVAAAILMFEVVRHTSS